MQGLAMHSWVSELSGCHRRHLRRFWDLAGGAQRQQRHSRPATAPSRFADHSVSAAADVLGAFSLQDWWDREN